MKQLFLLRHASYHASGGSNPSLSSTGKVEARALSQNIKNAIEDGKITIWTSSAKRARETAEIIKQELEVNEIVVEENLWSDKRHPKNFHWLADKIDDFEGEILIIITHLEYVQQFPEWAYEYDRNWARTAEGVVITNNSCINFS